MQNAPNLFNEMNMKTRKLLFSVHTSSASSQSNIFYYRNESAEIIDEKRIRAVRIIGNCIDFIFVDIVRHSNNHNTNVLPSQQLRIENTVKHFSENNGQAEYN